MFTTRLFSQAFLKWQTIDLFSLYGFGFPNVGHVIIFQRDPPPPLPVIGPSSCKQKIRSDFKSPSDVH